MTSAAQSFPTIAFIGGGNMAAALIGGLLGQGWPASQLRVAEPLAARRDWLAASFGIPVAATAAEIAAEADAVVLAVKPQQAREALQGLALKPAALVVSIMAGVRLATLQNLLGAGCAYVRSMPNTPALLAAGITGLYAPEGTPATARALAERLLAAAGATVWVEQEQQLDAVTAVSGSGPAYFFLLVEAMTEAGVQLGLSPGVAAKLAAHTALGAGRMSVEEGFDKGIAAATLRANVTSKGGTTEAALAHLESAGVRASFHTALAKASARAAELGDALAAQ